MVLISAPLEADGSTFMKSSTHTILLLADRRHSETAKTLKGYGYKVMTTYTPDHAVAICVNNRVDAVILDQEHFVQTEGWSVAQSLKMIRHNICVVLVVRGKIVAKVLPEGVDFVVPEQNMTALTNALKQALR